MEYLEGEALKQRLARSPISLKEAVRVTAQVAEGLETAAEKKIVCRDVEPSNIMLTRQGRVKVTDLASPVVCPAKEVNRRTGQRPSRKV